MRAVILCQHELRRLGDGRLIELFRDDLVVFIEQGLDLRESKCRVLGNTLRGVSS